MSADQPLLPAEPWYKSEVQVRAVIAIAFQVVSVVLRMVGRYTEVSVTNEQVDLLAADISQLAAFVFAALAIIKRQTSTVQPLTLTAKSAQVSRADNPSVMDRDPTKQAGFIRAAMLGLLLAISVPAVVVSMQGCATTQALTFDQQLKLATDSHTAVVRGVTNMLDAKRISSASAERVMSVAKDSRALIDAAVDLSGTDIQSAQAQLQLANDLLLRLDEYLAERGGK